MGTIHEISDSDFEAEVLNAGEPVLVDFWAPWCIPCRAIAPLLEQLAAENGDGVKIVKVNIDDNQHTASHYQVASIPTLILFKGGQIMERFSGIQPKYRLQEAIDQAK